MVAEPWLHLALVEPLIPQNTGNIGRIALAFGVRLHLVGKLGFSIDEKACRRAGLDYWKHVDLARWDDLGALEAAFPRQWLFSAHGKVPITEAAFERGDVLVFGNESTGLRRALVDAAPERSVRIPLASPLVRSLNLANAVSIATYEAARRLGFPGAVAGVPPAASEALGPRDEPGRPSRRSGSCAR
jgi:tRNA (cytidine/uridine-2'-O-)-methyltransferase